jgi:hypothetical protein
MQQYVKSLEEAIERHHQPSATLANGLPAGVGSSSVLLPPTNTLQSDMDGLTDVQPIAMANSAPKRKGEQKLTSIPGQFFAHFFWHQRFLCWNPEEESAMKH